MRSEAKQSQWDSVVIAKNPLAEFARVHGKKTPEAAMREICSRLRRHCDLSGPPFGLRPISKVLRARVERSTDLRGKLQGVLERRDIGYVIRIDGRQHWRRSRFTIAHELGHILLIESLAGNNEALQGIFDPQYWGDVEELCNLAADELLMPMDDMWTYLYPDTLQMFKTETLSALYNRYLVSYSALFKRLLDAQVDAVMLWRRAPELETNVEWRLYKVFHKSEHFIPSGISAERHLYPNPLSELLNKQPRDLGQADVKLHLRNEILAGKAVLVPHIKPPSAPMFEGFNVPGESNFRFDAVMLFRFDGHKSGACHMKAD